VQQPILSSSQKDEVLRRQAFKCAQCETDLEPVGRETPRFERVATTAAGGAPGTASFRALCSACHAKSSSNPEKASEERTRSQRDTAPARSTKKFVKSGFDTRKF
jgi:cytochrome c5